MLGMGKKYVILFFFVSGDSLFFCLEDFFSCVSCDVFLLNREFETRKAMNGGVEA